MASIMKQAMNYLGLGPDDSYASPSERPAPAEMAMTDLASDAPAHSGVTVIERPTGSAGVPRVAGAAAPTGVRRVQPSTAQPFVLMPRMFDDAQQIGDRFKRDQPIILNLQGLDRDTARRLLDFASGLCYACDGEMRKVANAVYMLVPANVVVTDEDRRRVTEQGIGT
ncbi:cell division protein SepF [Candidatus Poriferisodalis sp.]|uniref:cell division protein SepF n=1 Tax=Candidatus Poriferisodalis sp. TaxID=3101277 RepID=UPI003D0A7879